MQAVVLVLLLGVSLCGVHGSDEQLTPDVLYMVKELMINVQMLGEEGQTLRTKVQSLETKVQTLEKLNQTLQTKVQSLETQDQALQTKVQTLQTKVQTLQTQDQTLRTKIQTLETQDQALRTKVQTLETQDHTLRTKVQTLEIQDQALWTKVQSLQTKFQILDTSVAQQLNQQVAFFARLYDLTKRGNYGPFNVKTTIKYERVQTNVGNGYNASTGVFTAPLRGLYVFHFTMFTGSAPSLPNARAGLMRNGSILAYALDKVASDNYDSSTCTAVVTLEAGDRVYVELDAGSYFYGSYGYLNNFSGFLLSPM